MLIEIEVNLGYAFKTELGILILIDRKQFYMNRKMRPIITEIKLMELE